MQIFPTGEAVDRNTYSQLMSELLQFNDIILAKIQEFQTPRYPEQSKTENGKVILLGVHVNSVDEGMGVECIYYSELDELKIKLPIPGLKGQEQSIVVCHQSSRKPQGNGAYEPNCSKRTGNPMCGCEREPIDTAIQSSLSASAKHEGSLPPC
ncbi:hypothetical protein STEG23_031570, partial [Scotinomys teguina]